MGQGVVDYEGFVKALKWARLELSSEENFNSKSLTDKIDWFDSKEKQRKLTGQLYLIL